MNTIILYDNDADLCTAVIRTKEDVKKISNIIVNVKDSLEGEWSFDVILQGLMDSCIEYEIEQNVSRIYY